MLIILAFIDPYTFTQVLLQIIFRPYPNQAFVFDDPVGFRITVLMVPVRFSYLLTFIDCFCLIYNLPKFHHPRLSFLIVDLCIFHELDQHELILILSLGFDLKLSVETIQTGHTYFIPYRIEEGRAEGTGCVTELVITNWLNVCLAIV